MLPLPLPVRGGSIESLAPFLNLASENDFVLERACRGMAVILGALRAGGPYPVLAIRAWRRCGPCRAISGSCSSLPAMATSWPLTISQRPAALAVGYPLPAHDTRRLFTDHHQLCGRLKEVGHSIAANIDTDLQKVGCASRPLRSFGHELAHMSRHRVRCSRSRRAGYCNKRFQGSGRNSLSQAVAQSAKSAMRGQPLEAHPRQHAQGHGRPHRGGAG